MIRPQKKWLLSADHSKKGKELFYSCLISIFMKNHRILREHSEQILVIRSACCSPLCTCGHQFLLLLRKLQVQICWDVKNSIHIAWTSLLHEHAVHRTLIWFHLIKWHFAIFNPPSHFCNHSGPLGTNKPLVEDTHIKEKSRFCQFLHS